MENNLKELREAASLSLQELSDMSGKSFSCLQSMEAVHRNPSLETAYAIANVLGKSVYQIWPDTTEIIEETITVRRVKK